jgi:hypothetical protein
VPRLGRRSAAIALVAGVVGIALAMAGLLLPTDVSQGPTPTDQPPKVEPSLTDLEHRATEMRNRVANLRDRVASRARRERRMSRDAGAGDATTPERLLEALNELDVDLTTAQDDAKRLAGPSPCSGSTP